MVPGLARLLVNHFQAELYDAAIKPLYTLLEISFGGFAPPV